MRVRRDYREPFFRERRRGFPWRNVVLILVFFAAIVTVITTQPALLTSAAYAILGNAPTPTPLPRELIDQAVIAAQNGDLPVALSHYKAAIAQRPNNIDYLYDYGQLLIDADNAEEALIIANTITTNAPNDVRGYTLKTRAMAWLGQFAAAIPVGLQGQGLDENFGPLYEALSRAYAGEARWRESLDSADRATQLSPNDARGYWAYGLVLAQTGNPDLAIEEMQTAVQLNPTLLPPYFELAFLLLSLDRNQEAIDLYDRILGMQPRNARALLRQCDAYRKVGEFNRALGLCQDAVSADPTYAVAQYRLGTLRYSRREFQQSFDAFSACLEVTPDNLQCRYMMGLSQYYLGDCNNAETVLLESQRMAQSLTNGESDLIIINEGLLALANDVGCTGLPPIPPTLTPEATPEVSDSA